MAGLDGGCDHFCGRFFQFGRLVTVFVGNTNLSGTAADVFVPPSTNINVNDRWYGSGKAITIPRPAAPTGPRVDYGIQRIVDSGVNSLPHSFTNTFTSAGSFLYFCSVQFQFWHDRSRKGGCRQLCRRRFPSPIRPIMPPSAHRLPSRWPQRLPVRVEPSPMFNFSREQLHWAMLPTAPYSVPVNSLAAADYTFSAVASDNAGLTATNAVTVHVVTPVAILLSAPQFLSPSDFRFNYTANPGLTYIVQRSSSLSSGTWTTLSTNVAGSSPVLFDDPTASGNPGYYRVGLLPNP